MRHVGAAQAAWSSSRPADLGSSPTALDTVIQATAIGRAALRTYRFVMGFVLAVAILLVLGGAGVELGFRALHGRADHRHRADRARPVRRRGQWWTWSAGLRFLKEHVEPERKVSIAELPGRFASLGREVMPTSETLGRELEELSRSLDGDRHP